MGRFKKGSKTSAEIPTSALPDIIFILLFFFIVTTTPKKNQPKVKNHLVNITQMQKLEHTDKMAHIYVGRPKRADLYGLSELVQINDAFIEPADIPNFIEMERNRNGGGEQIKVFLKIDEDAKMGVVDDVQQGLREVNAREVYYSGKQVLKIY